MGIKFLYVMGDSKFVVNHIKNKYRIKKFRLKAYAKKVWDLIDTFEALDITFIHREKNHREDSLADSTSMFILMSKTMKIILKGDLILAFNPKQ